MIGMVVMVGFMWVVYVDHRQYQGGGDKGGDKVTVGKRKQENYARL